MVKGTQLTPNSTTAGSPTLLRPPVQQPLVVDGEDALWDYQKSERHDQEGDGLLVWGDVPPEPLHKLRGEKVHREPNRHVCDKPGPKPYEYDPSDLLTERLHPKHEDPNQDKCDRYHNRPHVPEPKAQPQGHEDLAPPDYQPPHRRPEDARQPPKHARGEYL